MDRDHNLVAAGVLALALALPAAAQAATDRNHDRIPDAWERTHHLSLHADQSRRDQDRDGLRNRSEYRDHTDPHRRDSDRDGVPDGREDADHDGISNASEQEHPGSPGAPGGAPEGGEHSAPYDAVGSFADGVLHVRRADGTDAAASVDAATKLLCAPPVQQSVAVACPPERLVAGTRVLVARQTAGHWDYVVLRADPGAGTPVTPPPPAPPAAPAPTGVITGLGERALTITRPSGEVVPGAVGSATTLSCVFVADGHAVATGPCGTSHVALGVPVALAQRSLVDGVWTWTTIVIIEPAP